LVDVSDAANWCSVHRNCRDLISICEDSIKLKLISTNDKEWCGESNQGDKQEDGEVNYISDHTYNRLDHRWDLLVELQEVKSFGTHDEWVNCAQSSQIF
jgi:hypothetical protein